MQMSVRNKAAPEEGPVGRRSDQCRPAPTKNDK
jgi:hypothetical protein